MENSLISIVMLLIGFAIGMATVWLVLRSKAKESYERARLESIAQLTSFQERLAARDSELEKLRQSVEREEAEAIRLREQNANLKADLEGERRAALERREAFKQAAQELTEKFKALSRDALKDNNQSFLELANASLDKFHQTAKGDLEMRQRAIDQLIEPLRESLERVDGKIGVLEKERIGAYSELREQVKALATSQLQLQAETGNLVKALRTPNVRGRWGEIQLRRVVELAGMLEYCDFVEQETITGEDGRQRPDLIVRLPGNRTIVVDSKVPFDAFYESISTSDDGIRDARLKDHARIVRSHILSLSRKSYWETVQPTPEFVLLFLPGEAFYSAALENDPKLIEDGVAQGVIIATPTTLIALLKAVSYGWRQEQMTANAVEIGRLGKDLYDRLRTFTGYFTDVGKSLDRAVDSYNRGVGSFEARVLVTARKLKERGAAAGEDIDTPEPINQTTRALRLDEGGLFPDLIAGDSEGAESELLPLLNSKSAENGEG